MKCQPFWYRCKFCNHLLVIDVVTEELVKKNCPICEREDALEQEEKYDRSH